jgi:mannose-6-phosphate isomerase-like protein (cupin superfamily)
MRLMNKVEKGWGYENIFVSTEDYCGKELHFKEGGQCSMHFHLEKDETWYVNSGKFKVIWIELSNGNRKETILNPGDTWRNEPLQPHKLECIEAGFIIEVSTADSVEDNYRIEAGDSQKL